MIVKEAMHPLDVVRASFSNWSPSELAALSVAMRKAHELVKALEARFKDESPQVGVIVNKYQHKLFGGGLRKSDATALLGEALVAFVPDEQELISEAINQGDLASAVKRSSRVSRELTRLMFKE